MVDWFPTLLGDHQEQSTMGRLYPDVVRLPSEAVDRAFVSGHGDVVVELRDFLTAIGQRNPHA
jgi:hypothetical protein